jgi:hypothetical protein
MAYRNNKRIWIIEAHFTNGCDVWEPCTFGIGAFASDDYFKAHRIKRSQQEYLKTHGSKTWYKNKFRVVEYVARQVQRKQTIQPPNKQRAVKKVSK